MNSILPVIISITVFAIGLVGLAAALIAANAMRTERQTLRRGRGSLRDLPAAVDYDYRKWINERHLDDSHFADHLRGASDAARAGRAVSLSELHQVSARREASRRAARLSGGVTGLLLVCGIAGTLWCIKPILSEFNVNPDPNAVNRGTRGPEVATQLIQDLSRAFWPSLVALIMTVLVASARGLYTHGRGMLSGELDQLDLEDLFGRFPPPSISRELNEVRAQLGNLVVHIVSSQRNFDGFVERLTNAAQGFGEQAPPLHDAAGRFSKAANRLAPKIDELILALSSHLGPNAPILQQLGELQVVSQQVTAATGQMELSGKTLSNHMVLSHQVLKQVSMDLPAQMQSACQAARNIIADATSAAITTACTEAVRSLDAAAAPVRQAAAEINQANQSLRTDIVKTMGAGVEDLRRYGDETFHDIKANGRLMVDEVAKSLSGVTDDIGQRTEAMAQALVRNLQAAEATNNDIKANGRLMVDEIAKSLREVTDDMHQRTEAMAQAFTRNLQAAVETVTKIQGAATDAINRAGSAIGRLDDLQRQTAQMLDQCAQGRRDVGQIQHDIDITTTHVEDIGQRIQGATGELGAAIGRAMALGDQLARMTSEIDRLTAQSGETYTGIKELNDEQQAMVRQLQGLVQRGEQAKDGWQTLYDATGRLLTAGGTLNTDLARLLTDGGLLAKNLDGAVALVMRQQGHLSAQLEKLQEQLGHLDKIESAGLRGLIFGRKG